MQRRSARLSAGRQVPSSRLFVPINLVSLESASTSTSASACASTSTSPWQSLESHDGNKDYSKCCFQTDRNCYRRSHSPASTFGSNLSSPPPDSDFEAFDSLESISASADTSISETRGLDQDPRSEVKGEEVIIFQQPISITGDVIDQIAIQGTNDEIVSGHDTSEEVLSISDPMTPPNLETGSGRSPDQGKSKRPISSTRTPSQRPVFAAQILNSNSNRSSSIVSEKDLSAAKKRKRSSSRGKDTEETCDEALQAFQVAQEYPLQVNFPELPYSISKAIDADTKVNKDQQAAHSHSMPTGSSASVRLPYGPKTEGPPRPPRIWTDNRQELCESLDWFLSYQGGIYTIGNSRFVPASLSNRLRSREDLLALDSSVYGYLLAGWGSTRDAWEEDGRVIISHGGGKSTGSTASGPSRPGSYSLSSDQLQSSPSILALLKAIEDGSPIVLLASDSFGFLPFNLNCGFAVLGWYLVTDAWAEREPSPSGESFTRWKFRFEYLQCQGPPWWSSDPEINPDPVRTPFWNPRLRVEKLEEEQELVFDNTKEASAARFAGREQIRRERNESKNGGDSPKSFYSKTSRIPLKSSNFERLCSPSGETQCRTCFRTSPQVYSILMCLSPSCSEFWRVAGGSSPSQEDLAFNPDFLSVRKQISSIKADRIPFPLAPPQPDLNSSESHSAEALKGWHCLNCGRLNCREIYSHWECLHCSNQLFPNLNPFKSPPRLSRSASLTDTVLHDDFQNEVSVSTVLATGTGLGITTYSLPRKFGKSKIHVVEALEGNDSEADKLLEELQCSQVPFVRHPLSRHGMKGRLLSQQFSCNYGTAYKHLVKMSTIPFDASPPVVRKSLELITERTALAIEMAKDQFFNELYPVLYLESQSMHFHDDGQPGLGPVISSLSLGSDAIMRFRVKQSKPNRGTLDDEQALDRDGKEGEGGKVLLKLTLRHGSVVVQDGADLQTFFEHSVEPEGERIAVTARHIDERINSGKNQAKG